jgi:hypothetical protein
MLAVLSDAERSFDDWLSSYEFMTIGQPITEVKVGGRRGFVFVMLGTFVVVALDDCVAVVSMAANTYDDIAGSLPVKAAAALA